MKPKDCFWIGVVAALVAWQVQQPVQPSDPNAPAPVTVPADKATAATYVYEKNATAIPDGVSTGLSRLNRERKIVATLYEQPDEGEKVPRQYKVALTAAQEAGLPALVVTAGEKVLRVTKAPTTEQQVWEACQ